MLTPQQEWDLDIAREIATAGVPVLCAYPDPEGRTQSGRATGYSLPTGWQNTTPNSAYVSAWKPGMALLAVMGHGLDLLDGDPRHGGDLAALDGITPRIRGRQATPSGGEHWFVSSMGVRSRDAVLPGIDVKAGRGGDSAGRGFAFIAPTVRNHKVTGEPAAYRWIEPPDLDGLREDLAEASATKLAAIVRQANSKTRTGFQQPGGHSEGWTDPDIAQLIREGIPLGETQQPVLRDVVARLVGQGYDRVVCWGIWQAIVDRTRLTKPEWPWAEPDFTDMYDSAASKYGARPRREHTNQPPPGQEAEQAPPSRLDQLRGALLDAAGLKTISSPDPLIEGWVFRDSLGWLGGKPGHGKTFVAVDIACCVGTGTPWHGFAVAQGTVLYVIAEGAAGLSQRVDAWQLAYGCRADNVLFLPVAVQLMNVTDVIAFRELLTETRPCLVVLDTQARVTVGAEENSSRDMGMFVDALERLRQASGACILAVHHEPRNGENLRGSTALEGAATSILRVSKDGSLIEVTNPKQKDSPEKDPLRLALNPIGVSATVSLATGAITTDSERSLLTTLQNFGTSGASSTQLQEATGMPRRTYFRALSVLVSKGLIVNTGTKARTCYLPASLDNRQEVP